MTAGPEDGDTEALPKGLFRHIDPLKLALDILQGVNRHFENVKIND